MALATRLCDWVRPATVGLVALALAGCQMGITGPVPPTLPRPAISASAPELARPETAESAKARVYAAKVQRALLSQDLLRTDGGGPDTPYTDRNLAENFLKIAFYDEVDRTANGESNREKPGVLSRWVEPVRVSLRFGATVTDARRRLDTQNVTSYLARLAFLTGHPIGLDDTNPNFLLYLVSEDERLKLGPVIRATVPQLQDDVGEITALDQSTYCIVSVQSAGKSGVYTRAFAVIRAEHPDLLRQSCYHEEIAQALGLPNDSPTARPSIFNDNEEFALLTRQDELMLRMLYSPLLRPGMTEAEARPIVFDLATRLTSGES